MSQKVISDPIHQFFNSTFKGIQMNKFLKTLNKSVGSFAKEEDGAQVIEYALIVAVVSIALVIALRGLNGTGWTTFINRVTTCLTATCV